MSEVTQEDYQDREYDLWLHMIESDESAYYFWRIVWLEYRNSHPDLLEIMMGSPLKGSP